MTHADHSPVPHWTTLAQALEGAREIHRQMLECVDAYARAVQEGTESELETARRELDRAQARVHLARERARAVPGGEPLLWERLWTYDYAVRSGTVLQEAMVLHALTTGPLEQASDSLRRAQGLVRKGALDTAYTLFPAQEGARQQALKLEREACALADAVAALERKVLEATRESRG